MSDSTTVKILTLAFHPNTGEHEAVAAFLKARRLVPANPNFNGFLSTGHNAVDSGKNNSSDIETIVYNCNVPCRKLPRLIDLLNTFSSVIPEIKDNFYVIENMSPEWTAIGEVKLKLKCYIPKQHGAIFRTVFKSGFDRI